MPAEKSTCPHPQSTQCIETHITQRACYIIDLSPPPKHTVHLFVQGSVGERGQGRRNVDSRVLNFEYRTHQLPTANSQLPRAKSGILNTDYRSLLLLPRTLSPRGAAHFCPLPSAVSRIKAHSASFCAGERGGKGAGETECRMPNLMCASQRPITNSQKPLLPPHRCRQPE